MKRGAPCTKRGKRTTLIKNKSLRLCFRIFAMKAIARPSNAAARLAFVAFFCKKTRFEKGAVPCPNFPPSKQRTSRFSTTATTAKNRRFAGSTFRFRRAISSPCSAKTAAENRRWRVFSTRCCPCGRASFAFSAATFATKLRAARSEKAARWSFKIPTISLSRALCAKTWPSGLKTTARRGKKSPDAFHRRCTAWRWTALKTARSPRSPAGRSSGSPSRAFWRSNRRF